MKKIIVGLLLLLFYSGQPTGLYSQMSYGLKFGLSRINKGGVKNSALNTIGKEFDSFYRAFSNEYITNDLRMTEDLLNRPENGGLPLFFELGLYVSEPVNLRNRWRIELIYYNMGQSIVQSSANSLLEEEHADLGAFAVGLWTELDGIDATQHDPLSLINIAKNGYLRASIHYQFYVTDMNALSLGFSTSIATNRSRTNGFLFVPYTNYSTDSFFGLFQSFEQSFSGFSQFMPGAHLGALLAIRDYPKIEIRFSFYLRLLWGRVLVGIFEELDPPLQNAAFHYSYAFRVPNYTGLSIFLEL